MNDRLERVRELAREHAREPALNRTQLLDYFGLSIDTRVGATTARDLYGIYIKARALARLHGRSTP